MHRIDTDTAQADKFGVGKNGFTEGNPQTGELATALSGPFFDALQEEIAGVIEGVGITLSKSNNYQLWAALQSYFAKLNSPGFTGTPTAPTAASGNNSTQIATTAFVQTAINGAMVGIPLPWPLSTPPAGWLKCNGQSFNVSTYPLLAIAYPSGVLPDLRGEFIRGWDDGRGVNPIQPLLAWADARTAVHTHEMPTGRMAVGIDSTASTWVVVENDVSPTKVSTKQQAGGAGETAPRCIAFNYIVRAA